jgi:hypothetical protein
MNKIRTLAVASIACVFTAAFTLSGSSSATVPGNNYLISGPSSGTKQSTPSSYSHSVSFDGRYTAFMSNATNLVANDTNSTSDIFVKDMSTGSVVLISQSTAGVLGNNASIKPSISYDGRYVAFVSSASNFDASNLGNGQDMYVRDTVNNTTQLASKTLSGFATNSADNGRINADGRFVVYEATNSSTGGRDIHVYDILNNTVDIVSKSSSGVAGGNSTWPSISCDGSIVAFGSAATNLVPNDTNNQADIFVVDRTGGHRITNITLIANGGSSVQDVTNGLSSNVSCDGNFIAYVSAATNLVANDTNSKKDVFQYSRVDQQTRLISKSSAGTQGNQDSRGVSISGTGRYVAFSSGASNLVTGNTNGLTNIYIHDTKTGITEIVSKDSSGNFANNTNYEPFLSADGRYVAYMTVASNLTAADTDSATDVMLSETGY